ncbi:MAG: acetylglutamate kinase [SAR202 cluster bacterium]|nr:acetylglutamate kinase [SAR202 cluster bacterium]
MQRQGVSVVVVHGGGKVITDWMQKLGVKARFVRGLRVTDAESLDVVVAVLGGLVNKQLVVDMMAAGVKAVGMSGADAGILSGRVLDPELGYVGEVTNVAAAPVLDVLAAGYVPVIAPVAVNHVRANGAPAFLNVNADTAAGEIAAVLGADRLVFLTDVEGVLDTQKRLMPRLTPSQARQVITSGVAGGGMIPKLEACLRSLDSAPCANIVDGRIPHMLLDVLNGKRTGTIVEQGA